MEPVFRFVLYGEDILPEPGVLVVDVGMRTVPGVIDHHQPEAEAECAASLVVKRPELVLGHDLDPLREVVTHRLPDFDALAAIFLALRLLETRRIDPAMERLAAYARLVDTASLPPSIDLAATPYAILRALFAGRRGPEEAANEARVTEGLKFMRFLHDKAAAGEDLIENRLLFRGIDRYERAQQKVGEDHFRYLDDARRGLKLKLSLPLASERGAREVDGLVVRNPTSFLLKEWARRDRNNAPGGNGFAFLMTNFLETRYILGVDPGSGVNLKGLADLLNGREAEKRRAAGRPFTAWYDGNCPLFGFRIVDSPQDQTALGYDDILALVVEFGRTAPDRE
jgi:hypothetical protein